MSPRQENGNLEVRVWYAAIVRAPKTGDYDIPGWWIGSREGTVQMDYSRALFSRKLMRSCGHVTFLSFFCPVMNRLCFLYY
jgi:hypothetical protein